MLDGLHSIWEQLVTGYTTNPVLALLCLLTGLTAVLLWVWVKKWSWLWQNTVARSVAVTASSPRGENHLKDPFGEGDLHIIDNCLVLEWEVNMKEHGIGDIGNLEQKLLKLQNLRLDSAYQVVVSLFPDQGILNPKIAEILERRFPGLVFLGLESRNDPNLIQSRRII